LLKIGMFLAFFHVRHHSWISSTNENRKRSANIFSYNTSFLHVPCISACKTWDVILRRPCVPTSMIREHLLALYIRSIGRSLVPRAWSLSLITCRNQVTYFLFSIYLTTRIHGLNNKVRISLHSRRLLVTLFTIHII
jgi:hypothetical protein